MKFFVYLIAIFILPCTSSSQNVKLSALSAFYKPAENPILKADSTLVFYDSLKKQYVKWQRADVFNPAAIVKNGRVYLFTRSEDNPAAILGGRTSRIGLAVSDDGIHFKNFPPPVLYPDDSKYKKYDYPGGCEDPRMVEKKDGPMYCFIPAGTVMWQDLVWQHRRIWFTGKNMDQHLPKHIRVSF